MINRILLILLILISLKSQAQDAKEILKESYSKCLAINNGYYDMKMQLKFRNSKDTTSYGEYKFYFNRLKDDSVYFIAFNSELYDNSRYERSTLYTGKEYVTFSRNDSTAKIMSNEKWLPTLMNSRVRDFSSFYQPFTSIDAYPLPKPSDFTDKRHSFKFIDSEKINDLNCYHVQMTEYPEYDSTQTLYTVEYKYEYWINSRDMIPVKYSASIKNLQFGDTLLQYDSYTLQAYHLNDPENLNHLQLSVIPSYCNVQDYVQDIKIDLLKDTIAPNFTLNSLKNEPVSLSDYKGQLVLLDFFYKACYPCVKAIPILQKFHEKYNSKGLQVIGIDPLDDENSGIQHFVSKAAITYPVLLDKKDVNKSYRISSYPTLYLIDRKGNIIYTANGFSESLESKLEEMIKNNL